MMEAPSPEGTKIANGPWPIAVNDSASAKINEDLPILHTAREKLLIEIADAVVLQKTFLTQEATKEENRKLRRNYRKVFATLLHRYCGLEEGGIKNWPTEKLWLIEEMIYETARKKLLWKMPFWNIAAICLLPVMIFPTLIVLSFLYDKTSAEYPEYKFVKLRPWYKKTFGSQENYLKDLFQDE